MAHILVIDDERDHLTRSFATMAEDNRKLHDELRARIHDLEEATRAIEHSELKFRTLFNGTTDAIFVRGFTESGDAAPFIEVNEVACSRLGYSREELLQMSIEDINYSKSCQCLDNIRKTLAAHGEAVFETAHLTKDGRAIPVEISSHQFQLDGRSVILSVARDITERRKAEQELLESNDKYRQLLQQQMMVFDSSPVGIVLVRDRHIVSVNRRFCEMTGFLPEELLSKSTHLLYPSQEAYVEFGRKAYPDLMAGKITHHTAEFRRKDDSLLIVSITGGPVDKTDPEAGSVWIFEDITGRKEVEERVHKLSQAVEQSPVTIIITDSQGTIEFVNPKFSELTGYAAEEAIGLTPRILKSGQTPPEVYQKLWSTISSGNVWEGEFLNKGKDGRLFWEHATISPLRNTDGAITHYMSIKEDITERKHIFDQLVQSQKIESIGQLAGGIAHDFNNILSIISGYAYILKLELDKESGHLPHIEQILTASAKAAQLTQSLLAYSRKQVMNAANQNLNLLIANIGSFLTRLIGEHIQLTITTVATPLQVHVDSLQIEQVLMNLATNARDAMPDGGTFTIITEAGSIDEVFISSRGYGEIGRYAIISVADTGCGMSAETIKRIFDPFFTTKEIGKGTGLGMSMAMGIIKQHKGFIDVQSDVGGGTEFRIFLPLVSGSALDLSTESDFQVEPGAGTILVAEDEPGVRDFMEKLLTSNGYSVILAVDGQDAVEKYAARKNDIELVILDMVMPRKNGYAACEEIRLIDGSAQCLFVSGYAGDLIERQGELGENAILLNKPIQPQVLLSTIEEILKK